MYPKLVIDREAIIANAIILRDLAKEHNIEITPVVKALAGHQLVKEIAGMGFSRIGDSSLHHIRKYRDIAAKKWLLRNPMDFEIEELLEITEGALISEAASLTQIEERAAAQETHYQVILMAELGDLREGCEEEELLCLADYCTELPHIDLMGIGTNLSCYGNILPDKENMEKLADLAVQISARIGKQLPIVSGGNSTAYLMLKNGQLPGSINDLRFGESILLGRLPCYDQPIDGLHQNNFVIHAQIVELKNKPSLPWGTFGSKDSFGGIPHFNDKGRRKRAIVVLGKQEIHINGLQPSDSQVEILGGCSDFIVCDVSESSTDYTVGDTIEFICDYAALATGMSSPYITKEYK